MLSVRCKLEQRALNRNVICYYFAVAVVSANNQWLSASACQFRLLSQRFPHSTKCLPSGTDTVLHFLH